MNPVQILETLRALRRIIIARMAPVAIPAHLYRVGTFPLPVFAVAVRVGKGRSVTMPNRRIVPVIDGAGWHRSRKVVVPEGVHLVFLPPYSPELQPAERLFPLINEALANRTFESLHHLEQVLEHRLAALDSDPLLISDHTKFRWWPEDVVPDANRMAS